MKKAMFALLFATPFCGSCLELNSDEKREDELFQKTGKEAFEGFYVGIGAIQSGIISDLTNVEHSYIYDGPPIPYGIGDELNLKGELSLNHNVCITNVSAQISGGSLYSFIATGSLNQRALTHRQCKIGGTLSFGYGRFLTGPIYFGLDFSIDISPNKNSSCKDPGIDSYEMVDGKISGFTPSVAVKIGAYSEFLDSLIYARAGVARISAEVLNKNDAYFNKFKLSKLSPLLGIGIEKTFANLSARLECDYRFQTSKYGYFSEKEEVNHIGASIGAPVGLTDTEHRSKMQLRSKGYIVRLMFVYRL